MLTILLTLPFAASLIVLFSGSWRKFASLFSLAISGLELIIALMASISFNNGNQSTLSALGENKCIVNYFSMDGLSLLLVFLTSLVILFTILVSIVRERNYPSVFYFLVLLMEAALIGVFTTHHGFIFYIFWEMALIPVYFIAAIWGKEDRIRITFKFFIYTMAGSLFMLAALIYLYVKTALPHHFEFAQILHLSLSLNEQNWLIICFFIAFAIKIPIFPFHNWQPDTYVVAPPEGGMLLAGIMLKMGLYGIIRFILPISNHVILPVIQGLILLSLISLLYGSLLALVQKEIRRLIAYASLAHVGLMATAILSQQPDAIEGAVFQMIAHGINIIALFFVADIFERRTATTQIDRLGAVAQTAPRFAIFFLITLLGTIAVPLTNGFVGEFLMLVGMAQFNFYTSVFAGLSIILGAIYMLRLYRKSMLGETTSLSSPFYDLNMKEMFIAVPLVLLIIGTGIYTKPILLIAKSAVENILQ
jgi:NADH-quinone oxidoreductase subunit M